MIAYFGKNRPVYILHCKPAVADHYAVFRKAYRPESEAEIAVSLTVAVDPAAHTLFVEGVGIMAHYIVIGKHCVQYVIVVMRHFAERQAFGLNYYVGLYFSFLL